MIVAFDSTQIERKTLTGGFFGILGVGIEIENYEQFCKHYDEILENLKSKYNILLSRKVFKSYLLNTTLDPIEAQKFTEELVSEIKEELNKVYLFNTTIPPSKVPKVYVPGRFGTSVLTPQEFMKEIASGHTHLCAWKYLESVKGDPYDLFLDNFQSKTTKAWDVLKENKPKIFPHGDICNRAISVADLLVSQIDFIMKSTSRFFNDEILLTVAGEMGLNYEKKFIGQPDFEYIRPTTQYPTNTIQYIKEPIIIYVKEQKSEIVDYDEEREIIETSPAVDYLSDLACDLGGSLKFYQARQDKSFFLKKDVKVAYVGPYGESIAKIVKTNYNVEIIDINRKIFTSDKG